MNLLERAIQVYKEEGAFRLLKKSFNYVVPILFSPFYVWYYIRFKSRTFTFRGRAYDYFYHRYNTTWRNERAIEVPVVWDIVKEYRGNQILEVGNVLSHYFPIEHTVLDKYEKAPGVINLDVVDFQPTKKYDLIVSISTLEHVGWDEKPRESQKILRALENLMKYCTPSGKIIVTLPLGYNTEMDKLLREGKIHLTEQYCLKRVSHDNRWTEVKYNEIRYARYCTPFSPGANAVIIGYLSSNSCNPSLPEGCNC